YTHNIARSSGGGFGDRSGWSGSSGGYVSTRVRIPGLAGHSMRLRFDLTTAAGGGGGWWVDNVVVKAFTLGCPGSAATTTQLTVDPGKSNAGEKVTLTATVSPSDATG